LRHGQGRRFPSPRIKPDVRIARIRLSDWLRDSSREDVGSATMAQSRHAEFAEDRFRAERSDASLGRLVTSDEEMAHAVVVMSADGAFAP